MFKEKLMKALKIIGITLSIILILMLILMTLYCLFANEAYGIDMLTKLFSDGFIGGVKNYLIHIYLH